MLSRRRSIYSAVLKKGATSMRRVIPITTLLALAFALPQPAAAQNGSLIRTFVSAAGSGANPCTITQPCDTFARAYTQTAANGIITALDPGKYGPINIIGPVTINGNGWATITGPAGGNGINIAANANDAIKISGLELDGANANDNNGISFVSGKSLIVSNCVIRQFTNAGMQLSAVGALTVLTDSTIENNTLYGVYYAPAGAGSTFNFDHVRFLGNNNAMSVEDTNLPTNPHTFTIANGTNSVAVGNGIGFDAIGGLGSNNSDVLVNLDNVTAESNTGEGIRARGATINLSRSRIGDNVGFVGYRIDSNGEIVSAGNNVITDTQNVGNLVTDTAMVQ
jgi:hypothetical protein